MRHLIYKKEEKQKQAEEDLTLPKDMLDNFTSVQIRGILSIKPNLEKQILNIWRDKKKAMNRVILKLKIIRR